MPKQPLNLQRIIFLTVIAGVFLFAYIADFNIFRAILEAISFAAPYVEFFIKLFLVLCFASLGVYYYLVKFTNHEITKRYLAWLKIFSWSFFAAFVMSCLIVYLNIYFNKTFDNT
ncbi:MAG: hypothetical protein IT395_01870 [Candidatus Omnitrophica bacterium]|nr:hypothetical protein [Candidatus Omnitrophota bacterium]